MNRTLLLPDNRSKATSRPVCVSDTGTETTRRPTRIIIIIIVIIIIIIIIIVVVVHSPEFTAI